MPAADPSSRLLMSVICGPPKKHSDGTWVFSLPPPVRLAAFWRATLLPDDFEPCRLFEVPPDAQRLRPIRDREAPVHSQDHTERPRPPKSKCDVRPALAAFRQAMLHECHD